jgi:hypothetical protein
MLCFTIESPPYKACISPPPRRSACIYIVAVALTFYRQRLQPHISLRSNTSSTNQNCLNTLAQDSLAMEAAAAVGVAAAAVQFLDFSVKTLALCREIRDSSTGSTKTNDELTKSIEKLTAMQKGLRQSGSTPSSTYRQLIRAVQDCSTVASELLKLLEDIREAAKKSLGTMRSALKAMKERKAIEKLQARLADCQVKYHMALTTDMRNEILRRLEEQGKNTDSIRDIILKQLNKASSESAASYSTTHGKLHSLGEKSFQHYASASKASATLSEQVNVALARTLTDSFRN